MSRTKKKKKHIIFYDSELGKRLNEIKKAENLTYDELLKKYLKLPDSIELIGLRYYEVRDLLKERYKNPDLPDLMNLMWVLIIKAALGEYDIKRLKYDIENDITLKTYKKR